MKLAEAAFNIARVGAVNSLNTEDNLVNNDQGQERKGRVRSPYLFPVYGLGLALQIAAQVESDGGGTLTEETLAIAMTASVKSSTFRLKALTPRQFGLLEKSGPNLSTTRLAKAILKPANDQERADALWNAFVTIPLFRALAERYKGQPLPQGDTLRNILEREFGIERSRVTSAERVLMDSAREAGALRSAGTNVYLALETDATGLQDAPARETWAERQLAEVVREQAVPSSATGQFAITEQDLALLSEDEFETLWKILGRIARHRGRRQLAVEDRDEEAHDRPGEA